MTLLLAILACDPEPVVPCEPAAELCDGLDNDCDGVADEGFDVDGDGAWSAACAPLGATIDCDDGDAGVYPGAEEACDGLDADCDGAVDEGFDADADGATSCGGDCDDSDPFVHPDATEVCDGLDNDCSGAADEPFDEDGDGVSPCGGDCDDADPWNAEGLTEGCDGYDNDCDGVADEGFDADGDGVSTCRGDCDDGDPAVYPGAPEICDGQVNGCDDGPDEGADADGDGYPVCVDDAIADCDDTRADVHPGAEEICDSTDNDCNGQVDEHPECFGCIDEPPYLICEVEVSWGEAADACDALGGWLAIVDSEEENALLAEIGADLSASSLWIGLSDAEEEGVWRWVDGTEADYTSWNAGEPNDYGGEDCVHTNYGVVGLWNDYPCGYDDAFACEY